MLKSHIIMEFYKADALTLATELALRGAILAVLNRLDLKIKKDSFIQFEPEGVTATIVGENFHFSIHTWPEFCSCAIDLYSNEDKDFTRKIAEELKIELKAQEYDLKVLNRLFQAT